MDVSVILRIGLKSFTFIVKCYQYLAIPFSPRAAIVPWSACNLTGLNYNLTITERGFSFGFNLLSYGESVIVSRGIVHARWGLVWGAFEVGGSLRSDSNRSRTSLILPPARGQLSGVLPKLIILMNIIFTKTLIKVTTETSLN